MHSVILMAIVGPNDECIYVDVGTNGRVNDSGVWNKSLFLKGIEDGRIHLPSFVQQIVCTTVIFHYHMYF